MSVFDAPGQNPNLLLYQKFKSLSIVFRVSNFHANFFMSNFGCCQVLNPCQIPGRVKFPGAANELGAAVKFCRSWKLGAARHPIFSTPERVSCKASGRKKLEKFRKFIYNKRGNININISTIKLNPSQIFRPHKKCGPLSNPRDQTRARKKEGLDFSSLSKGGDIWVSITP